MSDDTLDPQNEIDRQRDLALIRAGLEFGKKKLHAAGDRAYCLAMELSKASLCLGEEHKINTGAFRQENLKALEAVRTEFGKASGFWEAEKILDALSPESILEEWKGGGK